MNKKIGKRIRKKERKKRLSQEAMADKLNISRSAYSRIELGTTTAWVHHIENICETLNLQPEELLLGKKKIKSMINQKKHN